MSQPAVQFMPQVGYANCYPTMSTSYQPSANSGHSVLPNRSVWYFGSYANSVLEKVGTVRFLEKLGTEEIRYQ